MPASANSLNNHGTVVFLTKSEDDLLTWADYVWVFLGPLAGIFLYERIEDDLRSRVHTALHY